MFLKKFEGHGNFDGRVIAIDDDEGDKLCRVVYNDDDENKIDKAGMKELLKNQADATYNDIASSIVPAFDYPRKPPRWKCNPMYSLEQTYLVFRLARVFNPSFVSENEALRY
jgi:hypothetical protein